MLLLVLEKVEVVALDADNFAKYVNSSKETLVKFYVGWCHHCQEFAPEFVKLGEILNEQKFELAEVDCVVYSELCKNNGVSGYPTLLLFSEGENLDEYNGGRDPERIKQWLEMFKGWYE